MRRSCSRPDLERVRRSKEDEPIAVLLAPDGEELAARSLLADAPRVLVPDRRLRRLVERLGRPSCRCAERAPRAADRRRHPRHGQAHQPQGAAPHRLAARRAAGLLLRRDDGRDRCGGLRAGRARRSGGPRARGRRAGRVAGTSLQLQCGPSRQISPRRTLPTSTSLTPSSRASAHEQGRGTQRGAYMITATPTKHTIAPVMS